MAVVASLPANATILTFKQSEKAELFCQFPDREIHTIHEAEGITRKYIILVRLHIDESFLYRGLTAEHGSLKLNKWQLVGISRHNLSCHYVTIKRNDLVRIFEDRGKNRSKVSFDNRIHNNFLCHNGPVR